MSRTHRGGSARGPPRDIAPGLAEGPSAGGRPEARTIHRLRPEKTQTVALPRGFDSPHLHETGSAGRVFDVERSFREPASADPFDLLVDHRAEVGGDAVEGVDELGEREVRRGQR